MINKKHKDKITEIRSISTRVISLVLELKTKCNIKIIQAYASTSDHIEEEAEAFYDDVMQAMQSTKTYYPLIIGDFNAKLGRKTDDSETIMDMEKKMREEIYYQSFSYTTGYML